MVKVITDKPVEEQFLYISPTYTIARVIVTFKNHQLMAEGISRRAYGDKHNDEIAKNVALSKARRAMNKKLVRSRGAGIHRFDQW